MRQLTNLFATLLWGALFLPAQAPGDWTLRVDLNMSGENGTFKSDIQNCISQQLGALKRGVMITTVNPSYRLRVGTISLDGRAGVAGGFVISYLYSTVEKGADNIIFGAEPDKEILFTNLAMVSGTKGQERSVCQTIVTAFDAALLKKGRDMLDAIRKVQEGKK